MTDITVVIPTRNRRTSLLRTLAALTRQDYPPGRFEVVVAIDGGTDDTRASLDCVALPFALRVVGFENPLGAAAARNLGARGATAPLLLFLDDDIEAAPGLLSAHARARASGVNVSTGYLRTQTRTNPPIGEDRADAAPGHAADLFQIALRGWWEAMFSRMRRPGHRYDFRDVLTGNCAIDTDSFHRAGGFDESFGCHEDYEMGVRLVESSCEFRFIEEAAGVHHESTDLRRACVRKREEGRADVQMVRAHPHLVQALPLGVFEHYATRTQSLLRHLVFRRPAAARARASMCLRSLRAFEAARLRGRWQRRVHDLLHYWYWRGVAEAVPRFEAFLQLRERCRAAARWQPQWLDVDLAGGLSGAMAAIDARRPDAVRVVYGSEHAGDMPPLPGAERLRGIHLKAALARELAGGFVSALGRAGVVSVETRETHIVATGPLPVTADIWN